jgi:5-methylthioadenosine/S-adenosylhomocysteine deaminase
MTRILIKKTCYLNEKFELVHEKDILIDKGVIIKIGRIKDDERNTKIINGSSFVLTPSFKNAHFHLGETIYRGFAPIKRLTAYLKYTESKAKLFDEKDYENICLQSLTEAIKEGTGIIACGRGWKAVKKSGIKGALGYPLMKSEKLKKWYIKFTKKMQSNFGFKKEGIRKDIWIHSLEKIDNEVLKKISLILKKNSNTRMMIHLSETKEQVINAKKRFNMSEIELLDKVGILNERTNLIHCNYISNKDILKISKRKANITICPTSNINMRNSLPPIKKFLQKKINVSVGTDGLATAKSASLLKELNTFKKNYKKPELSSKELMKMITLNPSKTIGFEESYAIKKNFTADFCFFDYKQYKNKSKQFLDWIIEKCPKPKGLMIQGKFIMWDQKILTLNEKKQKKIFDGLQKRLK